MRLTLEQMAEEAIIGTACGRISDISYDPTSNAVSSAIGESIHTNIFNSIHDSINDATYPAASYALYYMLRDAVYFYEMEKNNNDIK